MTLFLHLVFKERFSFIDLMFAIWTSHALVRGEYLGAILIAVIGSAFVVLTDKLNQK